MAEVRKIGPQPGPQEAALACSADILVFGGQAGAGKTFGLLLEPTRHVEEAFPSPGFRAVCFRRTRPRITVEGGLWETSFELYPHLGAAPSESALEWAFPSGATVRFSHLEHDKDRLAWHGAQVPLFLFDQLEEFSETQFWYMLSRNRSTIGIRPYIRATANPQPGWLADLLAWWWDSETGYPIPGRSGVIRWFSRVGDDLIWGDTEDEVREQMPPMDDVPEEWREAAAQPKSITFIGGSIYDNPALLRKDPGYLGNLLALPLVERERLLKGNWKIRYRAGTMFFGFGYENEAPSAPLVRVRYWDVGATEDAGDATSGTLLSYHAGTWYVEDVKHGHWETGHRDREMRSTAEMDARLHDFRGIANTTIQYHQQEPGASGKDAARAFARLMRGFPVGVDLPTGDKVVRAGPWSGQVQAGNVRLKRAPWNQHFVSEHEAFPTTGVPDDDVDSASGAYNRAAERVELIEAELAAKGRRAEADYPRVV